MTVKLKGDKLWSRAGNVRPSALMFSAGVGAIVDLPHLTVVVRGLDEWKTDDQRRLIESRLLSAVQHHLGPQVGELRTAPYISPDSDIFGEWTRTGVPVSLFPRWLRCLKCNTLASMDSQFWTLDTSPYSPDRARFYHNNCTRSRGRETGSPAVAARFVLACRRGHLDEFPWLWFVHHGTPCARPQLTMVDHGKSLGPNVTIQCACGRNRRMTDAFGPHAAANLPRCRGRSPHLSKFQVCAEEPRAMVLGASNLWFSQTLNSLYLPAQGSELAAAVERLWDVLDDVDELAVLKFALKRDNALAELRKYETDDIWAAIEKRRNPPPNGGGDEAVDLKTPEWNLFTNPHAAITDADFKLRPVAPPEQHHLESVVLVERLREVRAFVGFSRIDAPDLADENSSKRVRIADQGPTWVPASEVRGEGIFLRLNDHAVERWESAAIAQGTLDPLRRAHRQWLARTGRGGNAAAGWPGERYVLLHTLSHILMRQMALDCGYSAASISERIYTGADGTSAAGVLLYTTASDSEGTLGGLVHLGQTAQLKRLLTQALAEAELCSSDPLCAEHTPEGSSAPIHGAACHACLFAAETSCERGNRYLDRRVLADVGENALNFFTFN